MKLNRSQKETLLQWVAEGLQTDEINYRAAECVPPFSVSRQQVDGYRKRNRVNIGEILQDATTSALTTGLALREVRVAKLQQLADLLLQDLIERGLTWTTDVKGIGQGHNFARVEIEKFNKDELSEYRALLDQIAGEVGDKKPDQVIPTEIVVSFGKKPDA